jgi:NADH-quinone oxidoreductase subunit H
MKEWLGFFDGASHPSASGWYALFGLDAGFPIPLTMLAAFVGFVVVILIPLSFVLGFAGRKLAADLQARVGPNRTAMNGLFQVFADFVKLGTKRERHASEREVDVIWSRIRSAALYSTFALIPFGTTLIFFDTDIGAFLPLLCFGIYSLGSLFANEGAHDLEDEITSHREAFLWVSAWTPALFALMVAVVPAGSAKWTAILHAQDGGFFRWLAVSSPFGFIAFFVFLFSGLVALQLPPFHSIDRGLRHRKGEQLALDELNEFYALFIWCLFASVLFLGGADRPLHLESRFLLSCIELVTLVAKASAILLLLRVVAKALPQLRQDQMTEFCWRVLAPISAVSLVGEVAWTLIFSAPLGSVP